MAATRTDDDRSPSTTGRAAVAREGSVIPTHIGRFVVLRKLGEGGMGVVYAAYDEELERKVAIKLLRGEFHGQRQSVGQARLQREAQAMARLSHPNIVQVYDVGKYGSGVFLAMEFVHGCDLREWQQRATRPWREVLAVYVQAGHGLAAAHAAGIVHRDFKPDNVLVGEDGRVRVVDFGLARPDEPAGDTPMPGASASRMAVELTQAGAFIGTPAYMAPEQLRRAPADARSDQFSFCVALYEGLYGHRPFPGADTASLKEAVLHDEPLERPRDTAVPGWVHQTLLRGLERAPERRFRDMPALLAALAADPTARRRRRLGIAGVVLASGLVAAVGGVAMYELKAASATACSGGRERLSGVWDASVAAATRAALVGTGVGYAEDVASRVVGRLDAYAEAWVTMHREACETHRRGEQSDALFDARAACLDERRTGLQALVEVLAQADAAVVEKAVQATDGLPALDRCADIGALLAQVPPPDDPETQRAVEGLRERLARVHAKVAVGQHKAALAEAGALRGEAEGLGYAPVLAAILRAEGATADLVGDYKTAEARLVRAIATADGAGDDVTRVAAAIDLVRVVGVHAARPDEGLRHAELVRGTLARLADADAGAAAARLEARVGEILLQRGDADGAEPHVERAIDLNRRIHGETSGLYATAIDARGTLRFLRSDLAGALADYRRAAALREEVFGAHHPLLAQSLNNVGAVELTQFANDAAEATFRRAEAILRGAYGETHPALGTVYSNVGMIAIYQGRAAQAVEAFRRALAIYETHLPADHPTIGDCLIDLGNGLLHAGDAQAAEQTYARALAVYTRAFGPGHAKTTAALASVGSAQLAAGAAEAAEKSYTRAVLEHRGDAAGPELAASFIGLGRLHLARGKLAEAIERLEGGLDRLRRDPAAAPFHVGEAQFLLAQALWRRDPVNVGRARALAVEARANYRRVGAGFEREAAAVDAWLATLPPA